MFSINTNQSAMNALAALDVTQTQLSQTQNEVSTGQKVAQASDNPAIYAIGQTMSAGIAQLSTISDGLNFTQAAVSTASSAAASISSQLTNLVATVTQAQGAGIDQTTMQNQINQILANINTFAQDATYNGVNLLQTQSGTSAATTSAVQDITGSKITVSTASASDVNGLGLTALGGANGLANASAVQVSAGSTFTTAGLNNSTVTLGNGTDTTTFEFTDGTVALTSTPTATNTVVPVLYSSTDSAATVLAKLATAMNGNGFNAGFDTSGDLSVTGENITAGSSSTTVTGFATAGVTGATAAIATVNGAISKLNANSASLGAAAQQLTGVAAFTTTLSNSLTSGLGALTDADMAAESAQLQSLQTKQQLAIQSLSIANQQPQALLKLFGG
jgi:flagellin